MTYRLPAPRTEFRLDSDSSASPAARVSVVTPGLTLKEGVISGQRPFAAFALSIQPDTRQLDGTYPVLVRIGQEGWLLYTPSLAQTAVDGSTRFGLALPEGMVSRTGSDSRGYIFIGPASYAVDQGALTIIAAPETSPLVRDRTGKQALALLSYYGRQLGRTPPPTVVALEEEEGRNGFVGHATPNGLILLRLTAAMSADDAGERSILSRFLAHELFHIWNAGGYRDRDSLNGEWLREGSAEYASWLAASVVGRQPTGWIEERLTQHLGPCIATLGGDALASLADQRAQSSRYSCGAIVHWLLDLAIRKSGRGTFFSIWGDLLSDPAGYDVPAFEKRIELYGADTKALRAILRGLGEDRWPSIFLRAGTMGAVVTVIPPDNSALRAASLQTLLQEDCKGEGIGFETVGLAEPPSAVVLRTEPMSPEHDIRCGLLAGDPHLLTINGHSALGTWEAIYRDVRTACAAGSTLPLTLVRDGSRYAVSIGCRRPALKPPTLYRVTQALPAADTGRPR